MTAFHGIVPPLVTPMRADGSLDLDSLDRLVDHLLGAGVDGLFVLGSSGQVAYLTDAQRQAVMIRVVERAAGRVPVVTGVTDLTAARVAEQAKRAEAAGVDGVVVTAPLYCLNDEAEISRHFRLVAAGIGIPVIAYDIPVRVHVKLSARLLLDLARDGVIAAVKDSSGDDVAFRRLVAANAEAGHPLSLLTGHEVVCDGMFLLGADGAVPGLANVDPWGYVRMWNSARAGDWGSVAREQARLSELFEIAFAPRGRSGDASGIGAFKAALAHLGIIADPGMPQPLEALDETDRKAVAHILARTGLSA